MSEEEDQVAPSGSTRKKKNETYSDIEELTKAPTPPEPEPHTEIDDSWQPSQKLEPIKHNELAHEPQNQSRLEQIIRSEILHEKPPETEIPYQDLTTWTDKYRPNLFQLVTGTFIAGGITAYYIEPELFNLTFGALGGAALLIYRETIKPYLDNFRLTSDALISAWQKIRNFLAKIGNIGKPKRYRFERFRRKVDKPTPKTDAETYKELTKQLLEIAGEIQDLIDNPNTGRKAYLTEEDLTEQFLKHKHSTGYEWKENLKTKHPLFGWLTGKKDYRTTQITKALTQYRTLKQQFTTNQTLDKDIHESMAEQYAKANYQGPYNPEDLEKLTKALELAYLSLTINLNRLPDALKTEGLLSEFLNGAITNAVFRIKGNLKANEALAKLGQNNTRPIIIMEDYTDGLNQLRQMQNGAVILASGAKEKAMDYLEDATGGKLYILRQEPGTNIARNATDTNSPLVIFVYDAHNRVEHHKSIISPHAKAGLYIYIKPTQDDQTELHAHKLDTWETLYPKLGQPKTMTQEQAINTAQNLERQYETEWKQERLAR